MTAIILGLWFTARQVTQDPSPGDVLSQVNQTYTNLDSYMDWGTVTFSYRSATGERRGDVRLFNTSFQRPNKLKYEFIEPASESAKEKRWVTWTASRGNYATWTNWSPHEVNRTALQKSLFRTWGMSEACGLPLKLLAPWALSGPRPTGIYNSVLQHEDVNGHPCWRIDGVCEDGAHAAVWVDTHTSLVLRYRHAVDAKLDGKPTNEIYTVELHPTGNPHLGTSDLRFNVPESGSSHHSGHKKKRRRRRG